MLDIFILEAGKVRKIAPEELSKHKDKPLWVDVTEMTKEERTLLKETFKLHPLTAEDLYHPRTRIKIEHFDEHVLCIFYGLAKNKKLETVEIDGVIGKTYVITNHRRKLFSISLLKTDEEKIAKLLGKGPARVYHKVIDTEVDEYFPIIEKLEKELDKIEQAVLDRPTTRLLHAIQERKKDANMVRRMSLQQREKFGQLAKEETHFIPKKALPYYRDVHDHSIRAADDIESYRERISSVFETYLSSVSNDTNEVMKVLSIIATIALPLTVIGGIYGTNFATLPGSTWPYGFWAMIGAMLLLVAGMLLYFRRKRWL